MGFVAARRERKRQEYAAQAIERRIARRKKEIERLEKLVWDLKHSDWGSELEKQL